MPERPEDVSRTLVSRLENHDVDGLEDLYEAGAAFADNDGVVAGWPRIRQAHERFLRGGGQLDLGEALVIEAGDLALVQWSWTVREADGSQLSGASAEVLRRQSDGSWKFVIDNSDGAGLIGRF